MRFQFSSLVVAQVIGLKTVDPCMLVVCKCSGCSRVNIDQIRVQWFRFMHRSLRQRWPLLGDSPIDKFRRSIAITMLCWAFVTRKGWDHNVAARQIRGLSCLGYQVWDPRGCWVKIWDLGRICFWNWQLISGVLVLVLYYSWCWDSCTWF